LLAGKEIMKIKPAIKTIAAHAQARLVLSWHRIPEKAKAKPKKTGRTVTAQVNTNPRFSQASRRTGTHAMAA